MNDAQEKKRLRDEAAMLKEEVRISIGSVLLRDVTDSVVTVHE